MDYEELTNKFHALAEADFKASDAYLNAPYRICHKGIYYKGRLESTPIKQGESGVVVGKCYRLTIEIPVVHIASVNLRDIRV